MVAKVEGFFRGFVVAGEALGQEGERPAAGGGFAGAIEEGQYDVREIVQR